MFKSLKTTLTNLIYQVANCIKGGVRVRDFTY